MKKIIIAVLVLLAVFIGTVMFVGRTYYPDNVAETAPDGGRKGLKTRFYDQDTNRVREASKAVIGRLSTWGGAWKLVDETDGGSAAKLKVEVPVVVFTDDLEVTIKKEEEKSRVDVSSRSRVGKSDFGENARHVAKFLTALDEELGS